jgi:hypothetical protein
LKNITKKLLVGDKYSHYGRNKRFFGGCLFEMSESGTENIAGKAKQNVANLGTL